jgi:putative NADPH-quinone reductase
VPILSLPALSFLNAS